jgi:hypothetical protein
MVTLAQVGTSAKIAHKSDFYGSLRHRQINENFIRPPDPDRARLHIENHHYPLRNRVMILLLFKVGLWAKEISAATH